MSISDQKCKQLYQDIPTAEQSVTELRLYKNHDTAGNDPQLLRLSNYYD